MANRKLNEVVTAATAINDNDLIYILASPFGSGDDRKMTGAQLKSIIATIPSAPLFNDRGEWDAATTDYAVGDLVRYTDAYTSYEMYYFAVRTPVLATPPNQQGTNPANMAWVPIITSISRCIDVDQAAAAQEGQILVWDEAREQYDHTSPAFAPTYTNRGTWDAATSDYAVGDIVQYLDTVTNITSWYVAMRVGSGGSVPTGTIPVTQGTDPTNMYWAPFVQQMTRALDVDASTPQTDGQVLRWVQSTQLWEPSDVPTSGGARIAVHHLDCTDGSVGQVSIGKTATNQVYVSDNGEESVSQAGSPVTTSSLTQGWTLMTGNYMVTLNLRVMLTNASTVCNNDRIFVGVDCTSLVDDIAEMSVRVTPNDRTVTNVGLDGVDQIITLSFPIEIDSTPTPLRFNIYYDSDDSGSSTYVVWTNEAPNGVAGEQASTVEFRQL